MSPEAAASTATSRPERSADTPATRALSTPTQKSAPSVSKAETPSAGKPCVSMNGSSGTTDATPNATAMTSASRTGAPRRCGASPSSKIASAESRMSGWRPTRRATSAASARAMPRAESAAMSSAISSPAWSRISRRSRSSSRS